MIEGRMSKERFIELTSGQDWASIEQYVETLDDHDFWNREFMGQALDMAKKHWVRRMVRTIKDDSGWPIIASIVTHNEAGDEERRYKQEHLFTLNDYIQQVNYHRERGLHHISVANGYVLRANARFNEQLELPFPGKQETD